MPKLVVSLAAILSIVGPVSAIEVPSAADQVASAVLAAPEERRAAATVIGWTEDGGNVVLRQGSNDIVCLSDNPGDEAFSVACYHESLAAFMARGRDLAREGVAAKDRQSIRFDEVEAGTLELPLEPRMLYVLHGSGYDATAGEVTEPFLRWVIYVPNATAESTGLPDTPVPGAPWLMGAGTLGAHIMITPARDQ